MRHGQSASSINMSEYLCCLLAAGAGGHEPNKLDRLKIAFFGAESYCFVDTQNYTKYMYICFVLVGRAMLDVELVDTSFIY